MQENMKKEHKTPRHEKLIYTNLIVVYIVQSAKENNVQERRAKKKMNVVQPTHNSELLFEKNVRGGIFFFLYRSLRQLS